VQALLDYARAKAPADYRFLLHRELNIPLDDDSHDFVVAFSVFTHLLHPESYIYLEEAHRVLRPSGRVVFSFLEFGWAGHWPIFEGTVETQRGNSASHLNTFIERSAIVVWCGRLGLICEAFIGADDSPWGGAPLGQTTVILRKPG
jgi:SAM-dependent methyltransferase